MVTTRQKTEFHLTAKDKTKAVLKGAQKNFGALDSIVGKLGIGFAGLAGAGGIGAVITAQVRGARQARAYSEALGVSTEALTAWQFAGESVGLEADKIADIMKDSAEKIGDAFRNNAGEAKEALESLNLSIEDMAQLSPDQQLLQVANALGQVGTQGEKVQILESLGNDASLLLPLLENNATELQRLMTLADETGVTLTQVEADKLKEVEEATREINAAFEGLTQTLVVDFSGALTDLIGLANNTLGAIGRVGGGVTDTIGEAIADVYEIFNSSDITPNLDQLDLFAEKVRISQGRYEDFLQAGETDRAAAEKIILDDLKRKRDAIQSVQDRMDSFSGLVIKITPEDDGDVGGAVDDKLATDLQKLQDSLRSEEQVISDNLFNRQVIADEAFENKLINEQEHMDILLALNGEFDEKMTALVLKGLSDREKFQRMSAMNQTKTVLGEMQNMTAGVAQYSRTMFEINKASGIANATIGAYEGFNKTMAAYPYPINVGLAGLSLAASLAQVDAIHNTSFNGGGGGSTPSAAGSAPVINDVPVSPVDQQQPQQQTTQIRIEVVGDGDFKDLVIKSIEAAESNDEIRIVQNG